LSGTGTITPKALSVTASAVDKVYDGTTAANGSLSALNVIGQDEVLLRWGPVRFASKNVSRDAQGQVQAQAVDFEGVQLSGVDAGNYSVSSTASSNAKITPKLLSVNGTRVANKTQDGNTETSVQQGLLSGLVGTEALQMQAVANFESADVGINKPVNVRYSLANGANDGLSGNYDLPDQRLSASIFAKSGGNVVQPIVTPTNGNTASSRVVTPKGAGASSGAATVSSNRSDSADVCSVATPESCLCQQTGLAGVEICFPGQPKPQPALLETGKSGVQATGV